MKKDEIIIGTKKQLLKWFCDRLLAPHDYIESAPGVKGEYKNLPIADQIDSILASEYPLGMVFYLEKVDTKSNPMVEARLIKKYVHVRDEYECICKDKKHCICSMGCREWEVNPKKFGL